MMDQHQPPKMAHEAPGLVWRTRKTGWAATWQARSDLVKRGYLPKTSRFGQVSNQRSIDAAHIATQCQQFQAEMLLWSRGAELPAERIQGQPAIACPMLPRGPDSPYQKNRYHVRQNRDSMLRRITKRHGHEQLSDIKARVLLAWHKDWSMDGLRLATGSAFIGQLRALFSFGATLLEDPDCERLCGVMHKMRFQGTKARGVSVTAEQATAIRDRPRMHFGWLPSPSPRRSSSNARCAKRTLSASSCRSRSPAFPRSSSAIKNGCAESSGRDRPKPDPAARHQQETKAGRG
jgi:hypothetical protein